MTSLPGQVEVLRGAHVAVRPSEQVQDLGIEDERERPHRARWRRGRRSGGAAAPPDARPTSCGRGRSVGTSRPAEGSSPPQAAVSPEDGCSPGSSGVVAGSGTAVGLAGDSGDWSADSAVVAASSVAGGEGGCDASTGSLSASRSSASKPEVMRLQLSRRSTELAHRVGQLVRTEDEQRHHGDDEQLGRGDVEHGRSLRRRPVRQIGGLVFCGRRDQTRSSSSRPSETRG